MTLCMPIASPDSHIFVDGLANIGTLQSFGIEAEANEIQGSKFNTVKPAMPLTLIQSPDGSCPDMPNLA